MPRAGRVCSVTGCPTVVRGASRCAEHQRDADQSRGTAAQRGYAGRGHQAFRRRVLAKHPVCVLCHAAAATVADHWPVSRRDLVAAGADPNDPRHGRGLCASCHGSATAEHQPGGWHRHAE